MMEASAGASSLRCTSLTSQSHGEEVKEAGKLMLYSLLLFLAVCFREQIMYLLKEMLSISLLFFSQLRPL